MSIRRGHIPAVDHFTIVPNAWLRDARLSRRARGLLAELMSHSPGWETSVESLVATGPEGRDAIRGALIELERLGYLARTQARDEAGRLAGADYEVTDPATDSPSSDNPTTGEPTTGEPTSADQRPKKTISQKNNSQNSSTAEPSVIDRAFDLFWAKYPRKVGKDAARKAFRAALKRAGSPAPIMTGLDRFVFSPDPQFQPHPSSWLNAGRFADEAPSTPARKTLQPWEM